MIGLDRDTAHLADLTTAARAGSLPVATVLCDLEAGAGLPLAPGHCGAVLVFRYLHRPLARALVAALAPGGLLLYETFTIHQRELGYGPRNADFLLQDDELLQLFEGLDVIEHWQGLTQDERPSAVARLTARRPT